jgi:5-methylcytosine-specific restriction endonuclease McrA
MRYPMRDDRVLAAGRRHDDITRWEVFEHYGWHCNACGVETPAYMIGTDPLNPRAPVVDHVLPVARGGEHIWKNLQLLCRQCNTIKGDKLNSELLEILEGMGAIRSSPNPRRHSLGASFFTSTEFSMNNLHKGMNNGTARAAT